MIDANYPSGAQEIIPKIRALTDKPIRFAFDTHHHGDHAYGNQVWVENGATPVAHTGVAEEMKKYEPGRWEGEAKNRPDVRASSLKPPSVLFRRSDFRRRQNRSSSSTSAARTRAATPCLAPPGAILFTGDACVNGTVQLRRRRQRREMGLDARRGGARGARRLPGHGARGGGGAADQQSFFETLRPSRGAVNAKRPGGGQPRSRRSGRSRGRRARKRTSATARSRPGREGLCRDDGAEVPPRAEAARAPRLARPLARAPTIV